MDEECDVKERACPKCHEFRTVGSFFRIITRRNNAPGSDDNGDTAYIKPTKLCSECRLKQKLVMSKRAKLKKENPKYFSKDADLCQQFKNNLLSEINNNIKEINN